jgi:hypothetical protein
MPQVGSLPIVLALPVVTSLPYPRLLPGEMLNAFWVSQAEIPEVLGIFSACLSAGFP